MKKGSLNFLGRKNNNLFDTGVKVPKEIENVEFVMGPTITPESGTASVRARPTVKHHASSSESFQGFAVPTPKVPLLPPVNGPKINGSVGGHQLSNGFVTSVPDVDKEDIFVPPPPSVAPPPPPSVFIPPPPDFLGDLNSLDPATLQHPSMPAPKEEDFSFLKPPPLAPPKPPSTSSTGSASSTPISSPPPAQVPEHPKFAAPQPPMERRQKTQKTPPPKPIRISSVSSLDSPPHSPAPPPPVQTPTLSTFNPQNRAKINSAPKTSILTGLENRERKTNHMLLLQDSGSANSVPVLVQVDGNASKVAAPSKPVPSDVPELKKNLQVESPPPEQKTEAKTEKVSAQKTNPLQPPAQKSPQLEEVEKANNTQMNLEPSKDKPQQYQNPNQKFSPLLDHKLGNLKRSENHGARDGHSTSPLALLEAAKEREKHRSTHSLSRNSSAKKNDQPSTHPSDKIIPETPESFALTQHSKTNAAPENSSNYALVNGQVPSTSPAINKTIETPAVSKIAQQRQNAYQSNSQSQSALPEGKKEEISIPFLPPPPEFDDLTKTMELPPSFCPPDPPTKKAPPPPISSLSPASVQSPLYTTQPSLSPLSSAPIPSPPPKTAPAASAPAPPLQTAPAASAPAPPPKIAPAASAPAPPPKIAPAASAPAPPPKIAPAASAPAPPLQTAPAASAPAPPPKMAPAVSVPPPPPKMAPPAFVPPPPLNPPPPSVQPKSQIQTKPRADPSQSTRTLEQRHFDLQCILKKKLEEMTPKMSQQKEDVELPSDEWEANDQLKPPTTHYQHKAAAVDMTELQRNLDKKYQQNASTKGSVSNGPKSKNQHGMTFTVRPGTKNPITYHE